MRKPEIRVFDAPSQIDATAWDDLLAAQAVPTPFLKHAYLDAMHQSRSASPASGWTAQFVTLWREGRLDAACPVYVKDHSYGEYVFDWAWANAYGQHGLAYYPKAVVAVPFTPVPGTRLLARDAASRALLAKALVSWCEQAELSSLHLLFGADEDISACVDAGMMLRHTIQFHWMNESASDGAADGTSKYQDFDAFLASLSHDKRKKIRQERRKVHDAGVSFRWSRGRAISESDWEFFYRCYARTYLEHGNAPYLTRDFFQRMADHLPEAWLLFVAERDGKPIASSLIALSADGKVAYGRYWGALERVDCLHFDACYYQPLAWCIEHGVNRFEGGAQGEHKMARALMPVKTTSAHWLAHPAFADAVERFLDREGEGIENYIDHLGERSPFRQAT
ncbi:MAG: GNAT family N-acetyltransferase [Gammaproteobacteria bacterium]|nr:GNAT family N-acetyltransferase [Gammaproteobacteria bacterium]MBU1530562.1 GNAT family N-acetyltransferase [Gammaproteobacteria bacterium]MBU2285297.1 GNAT family N-acetyltransferase [Gammaproteobacteria bacterium]MBU2408757.1 GNAT family N-acetyltransferase [Gammaproteobacteria bacterium]